MSIGDHHALDRFDRSSDFVASGLHSAYRWRPDPLASGCRTDSSGHQLGGRTAKRDLKKADAIAGP